MAKTLEHSLKDQFSVHPSKHYFGAVNSQSRSLRCAVLDMFELDR